MDAPAPKSSMLKRPRKPSSSTESVACRFPKRCSSRCPSAGGRACIWLAIIWSCGQEERAAPARTATAASNADAYKRLICPHRLRYAAGVPLSREEPQCMNAVKLGHAHLKVRDLDRAVAFYERFLGLHLVERVDERFVFMTASAVHHEVALQRVASDAPAPPPRATGLYHIAFDVPPQRASAAAYAALAEPA